jgi:hypothetical protein
MKTFENMAAQGDVFVSRIECLPTGAVLVQPENEHVIVAHSETGHSHVMSAETV